MNFNGWLNDRLAKTKESGLYRMLRTMNTAPSPEMYIDGQKYIVFSSNNYLGLANDSRLILAAEKALHEFGVGSSGSRLTTGNTQWHQKLEKDLQISNRLKVPCCFQAVIWRISACLLHCLKKVMLFLAIN